MFFLFFFYGIRNQQKNVQIFIGILEEISINYLQVIYAAGVGWAG